MNKFGRILLWVIPFTWPVALWRSIKHGQAKRDASIRTADTWRAEQGLPVLGVPFAPQPRQTPLGWLWRRVRAARTA